jgi:GNAT superfamily N-acetyltransferase
MLWKVRARVGDRPGTLARLAARCGDGGVNILGLQIHPTPEGVVDELVLSTPARWADSDVVDLVASAGGTEVSAAQCSLRALQDPAVRYLQAVATLHERGGSVTGALEELLATGTPDAADYVGHDELRVHLPGKPDLVVRRAVGFTPTERARAEAMAHLLGRLDVAGAADLSSGPGVGEDDSGASLDGAVLVRVARLSDVDALVTMHRRCSPHSLTQRYHQSEDQGRDFVALVRRQVQSYLPTLLATVEDRIVGVTTTRPGADARTVRCGLLVEDAWQRRGVGTMLLSAAARAAVADGRGALLMVARPGNDALLRTIGRCGLSARLRRVDDRLGLTVALTRLAPAAQSAEAATLV